MRCTKNTEVFSRVVGFMRPVNVWNLGKKEEFSMRKTFKVTENYTPEEVKEIKTMLQGAAG